MTSPFPLTHYGQHNALMHVTLLSADMHYAIVNYGPALLNHVDNEHNTLRQHATLNELNKGIPVPV